MKRKAASARADANLDPLIDLVGRRCCVLVQGAMPGAGFFVTAQHILTCAHVLGPLKKGDTVPVSARTGTYVAEVIENLVHFNDDLALIKVTGARGVPVPLDPVVWAGDELYAVGYPDYGGGQAADGLTAIYEARTELPDDRPERACDFLHKFKSTLVNPGFSGGPLINMRTARVVGVVSHSRSSGSPVGGWAIPIEAAIGKFEALRNRFRRRVTPHSAWSRADTLRQKMLAERAQRQIALAGSSEAFPSATPIANFLNAYLGSIDAPEPFGGRQSQLEALDEWNDAPARPYLVLTAPAGRGKSALLVRWTERLLARNEGKRGVRTHVVFIPVSVRFELNREAPVLQALATRLSAVHGESALPAADAPPDRWRELVSSMLRRELPAGVRLVVVIDGIDEAADWAPGPGYFPAAPARGVKLVLSMREQTGRSAREWLEYLNWHVGLGEPMNLPPLDGAGVRDVLRRMGAPLGILAEGGEIATQLERLSEGDPLILSLYVKDLWDKQRAGSTLRAEDLPSLAPGLDGYFERWWQDQAKLLGGSPLAGMTTRAAFNILATAFAPLGRRELLALLRQMNLDSNGDALDAALIPLARFLSHDTAQNTYVFSHPRFAMHRFSRLERDAEHTAYEELFLAWGRAVYQQLDQSGQLPPDARYIVRYYLAHLRRSDAPPEAFLPLLESVWRKAWEALPEVFGGYIANVDEVWSVLAAADRRAAAEDREAPFLAAQVRCALELAAHADLSRVLASTMVSALLRFGLWNGSAALQYARSREAASQKSAVLVNAIPALSGADLAQAEQQVLQLRAGDRDFFGEALAALCTRLCETGESERAAALAGSASAGYVRACAMLALARSRSGASRHDTLVECFDELKTADWRERDRLLRQFHREFDCGYGLSAPDAPVLEDATRRELLCRVRAAIAENVGASVDSAALADDGDCQFLEYLLPFLSAPEQVPYLEAFFDAVSNGTIRLLAADTIWSIGPFIAPGMVATALRSIRRLKDEPSQTGALLAIWGVLSPEQRSKIAPRLETAALEAAQMSLKDDRQRYFQSLARNGFTSIAFSAIRALQNDDWRAADLIEAIAPFLTAEETRAALELTGTIQSGWRDDALRAVLGRLAELGPAEAAEALRLASWADVPEATTVVILMQASMTTRHQRAYPGDYLRALASIADAKLRLEGLWLASMFLAKQRARDVAELLATFGDGPWAADALVPAAALVVDEEILADEMLGAVENIALYAFSETKGSQLSAFFRHAIETGMGLDALDFAASISTRDFQIPLLAAILAIGDRGDAKLASAAEPFARVMTEPWDMLAALAAIKRAGLDVDFQEQWQERVDELWELEVAVHAKGIVNFLRQLPEPERTNAFRTISAHCTFSRPEGASEQNALASLCEIADLESVRQWAGRVRSDFSGAARNRLAVAFAPRLALLGAGDEALELLRWISTDAARAEALAGVLSSASGELMTQAHEHALALEFNLANRLTIWRALVPRLAAMKRTDVLGLLETSLRHTSRSSLHDVAAELAGCAFAIARCGGASALEHALSRVQGANAT